MIRFIAQFLTILIIYLIGERLVVWLHLPIPGSIVGMAFLLMALLVGAIKLSWVEPIAQLHIKHISLLFIPFAVGILQYTGSIGMEGIKLVVILITSSLGVLLVTAYIAEFYETMSKRRKTH